MHSATDTEEPIYRFDGLKSLLRSMGYRIDKAVGYKPLKIADVDINDIRRNIRFTNDGIFLIDEEDRRERQIFLYKRNYHLEKYGKPRFHIRECRKIQEFIRSGAFKSEYRRANSEPVTVKDMDNGLREVEIRDLPLCKYCLNLALGEFSARTTSADFVEILKRADESFESNRSREVEVDILGYTKDWLQISLAYRESHEYTCEKCGLHISNPFDHAFMQTHHRNGIKTDNRPSNLQCLCIRCHANTDERHRKNFAKGSNRILTEEFESKYPQNAVDRDTQ